jgi:transposase
MLVVETIARIRRAHFVQGKTIKAMSREFGIARNTIRRILRSGETSFAYQRDVQPRPKLGQWTEELDRRLIANDRLSRRERLGLIRIFEDLRGAGYQGGYDAVRRYDQARRRKQGKTLSDAFVPLSFAPGEAYQFDWSYEIVVLRGVTTSIKVAQVRLCHSRMLFVRAYPRETQEMVFDAHDKAFAFFRGTCQRGIYDNMRTAVDAVFVGRERLFNRRFLQMCSHYLVEPTACTPASGWEKGQVENQVNVVRERFFKPRLRFACFAEMNAWLLERCVTYAKGHPHPECRDSAVWEMFEAERPSLVPYAGPFDGFHAKAASVSKTCLVQFDKNKYSVMSQAVGRPVEVHAYADRIRVRQDGGVIADHERCFGRDQTLYDPWHYVPVLARKPGAMRNGAPFKDWVLPGALGRVRQKLRSVPDGDRQMVKILSAVLTDGIPSVEAACAEALEAGLCSSDVVLNALSRQRQPAALPLIPVPAALVLHQQPVADCARYDTLRRPHNGTP